MRTIKDKNITRKDDGFTLLELSIVILIFGFIVTPLIDLYSKNINSQRRTVTVERVEKAVSQIRIYRTNSFSAPCPADRTLNINDANFGISDCGAAVAGLAVGACIPGGGICKVAGARAPSIPAAPLQDTVLIGAYPFRTISKTNGSLSGLEESLDGWNNKLTYAVSLKATPLSSTPRNSLAIGQDFKFGVIAAHDEFGDTAANNTAGINDDGLFVVLSHGETANGAYSLDGVLVQPCDVTTRDGENCDNDAVFRRAVGNYDAAGATFYDDYAYFFRDQTGDLWGYIYNPSTFDSTGHIRKLNAGNVGINTGTTTPAATLTVNGGIRADTTLTNEICSSTSTNCVPTQFLWDQIATNTTIPTTSNPTKTWRNTCAAGEVATKIADGKIACMPNVPIPAPPGGAGAHCPAGTYITTLLSNGCIVCTDGITYPSVGLCN